MNLFEKWTAILFYKMCMRDAEIVAKHDASYWITYRYFRYCHYLLKKKK